MIDFSLKPWMYCTLRYILRRAVIQSQMHRRNVVAIHRLLREALENEFTEDNAPTLLAFSSECYLEAWTGGAE